MSNKNKTIALASLIAAGAGVAAVAASNSHKQAKAKKIAEKQQAESGTPYRNTERGKYEKNSKGIYYTNGNYEAFAHPKKPEGVDEKSAYIVGSGLASLAAACFLVRDGQMPGDHIHILEAMDIAGGACDGIFDPSRGYVMRGGREMENHFECLWDLFRSIPSIETPGVSVLDEYYWLNKEDPNYSLCRATENRGEDAHTDGRFNLSQKGCMEIMKLFMTKDEDLYDKTIEDVFDDEVFDSTFWLYWRTMFAFENWHSALEMKLYFQRFIHHIAGLPDFSALKFTKYNQYESLILPMQRYLEAAGVDFQFNTEVTNVIFDIKDGKKVATAIECKVKGVESGIVLTENDLVFVTNGSCTEGTIYGDQNHAPNGDAEVRNSGCWNLWKNIAKQDPLVTGQRILDTLFPIAKGGTAALPGGFGTGKTMTQHQLAKWCDADIIIYIGCGERGNEMTNVLEEFGELNDPKTGNLLMDRTTLIANTSNMPVAAREASIYTGITLAEYYRDMGYHVAIMADSTSRWAEALRELSGRLEEMPAEEGFPAYLASRLSAFYERAGYVKNLNGSDGSVTIIGAVSPQGGDFSEPVTQNTKRFVRCFLALDKSLAYARHYPAINWLTSYSEYIPDLTAWYETNVGPTFVQCRNEILNLLTMENRLNEIVKLIGSDVLPDDQKLVLEIARVIRLGFLQQNAFHKEDTYVPMEKQLRMMEIILHLYDRCKALIDRNMPMALLRESDIFEKIISFKYDVANDKLEQLNLYDDRIEEFYQHLMAENA